MVEGCVGLIVRPTGLRTRTQLKKVRHLAFWPHFGPLDGSLEPILVSFLVPSWSFCHGHGYSDTIPSSFHAFLALRNIVGTCRVSKLPQSGHKNMFFSTLVVPQHNNQKSSCFWSQSSLLGHTGGQNGRSKRTKNTYAVTLSGPVSRLGKPIFDRQAVRLGQSEVQKAWGESALGIAIWSV